MSKEITIIGFDGPNRVGKGTQISLLAKKISEDIQDSLIYIVRGGGTRNGTQGNIIG